MFPTRSLSLLVALSLIAPTAADAYFPSQFRLPTVVPTEAPAPVTENVFLFPPPPLPAVESVAYTWDGEETMTRSTFVASIVRRLFKPSERCFPKLSGSDYSLLARDVAKDASYGADLCTAMRSGLINGYSDNTFHPNARITRAEAAKVLAKAFGLASDPLDPTEPWSDPFVSALVQAGVLSADANLNAPITRKEVSEMLWKLRDLRKVEPM